MQNKKTSVDASYLRKTNKRLILNAIFAQEVTSRAQLSALLRLSKPAISDSVAELLQLGVIEEIGEGPVPQKGGRKPMLLRFNKNHRLIISLDLSYSTPILVLGNLQNEVIAEADIRISGQSTAAQYVVGIENGIDRLLRDNRCDIKDIFCIAVSSPGIFDDQGNIITQNPGYSRVLWNESRLQDALCAKYGVKLLVKNDIKAATLGEWAYGAGQGEENLLYVSCGVGLGAGLVLNGELFEGTHFSAGEVFYYADKQGQDAGETLEDRVCMKRLIERCTQEIKAQAPPYALQTPGQIGFQDIVAACESKDPGTCQTVEQIALELCTLMFNLGNFLDLNKVIFGGEYAVFGETLKAVYKRYMKPRLRAGSDLHIAALGKHSSIYGMLFAARDAYFSAICM